MSSLSVYPEAVRLQHLFTWPCSTESKAANYPLIPEDFERGVLPPALEAHKNKVFRIINFTAKIVSN